MKTDFVRLSLGLCCSGFFGVACRTTEVIPPGPEATTRFVCISNEPAQRVPEDVRASLPKLSRSPDQDLAVSFSQNRPGGFAGVFIENHKTVLLFVDPVAGATQRSALEEEYRKIGWTPAYSQIDFASAEIRPARWAFYELNEWFAYMLAKHLIPAGGVNSWGIDEVRNSIEIGVVDSTSRVNVEAALRNSELPCSLVTTRIQGVIWAI